MIKVLGARLGLDSCFSFLFFVCVVVFCFLNPIMASPWFRIMHHRVFVEASVALPQFLSFFLKTTKSSFDLTTEDAVLMRPN